MIKNLLKVSFIFLFGFLILILVPDPINASVLSPKGDPDIDIRLRGRFPAQPTLGGLGFIDVGSEDDISITDPLAPQLGTISDGASIKTILRAGGYVNGTLTNAPIPADNSNNWGVTLSGLTNSGTEIRVPQSGYNIGGGYQVVILYATNRDIVISYSNGGDGIVRGYTIHIVDFAVDGNLLSLYQKYIAEGKVIALPCGYKLGTSTGSEVVAIRDTGSFMDPRAKKDWWQNTPQSLACENLPPLPIVLGESPAGGGSQTLTTSQSPIPEPNVPCSETRDNEFHSLRPYQSSPCGSIRYVEEETLFCGNDIVVKRSLSLLPSGGDIDPIDCAFGGDGSAQCTFQVEDTANIEISLKDSDLPIVGNTQLVPNEINSANLLSDTERVNNYVSWFLNGTVFVAEENPITNSLKDLERLVNFSGPLRKLLPAAIQYRERNQQIGVAGSTVRHNQIYECLLFGSPVACTSSVVEQIARLRPEGQAHIGGDRDALRISQYSPLSSTEDRAGEVLLPQPQILNEPTKPTQPILSDAVVEEIDFTPSSGITTAIPKNGIPINPSIEKVDQINPDNPVPARDDLYFAHMVETTELAELLQKTYKSVTDTGFSGDTGMDAPFFNTTTYTARCELADAKTNPGDDLFGDYNNTEKGYNTNISGAVHYKTNVFTVNFPPPSVTEDSVCIKGCGPDQGCASSCPKTVAYKPIERNVYAAMSVYTKAPLLNELAERLVGGTSGVVRRFFPFDIITDVIEKKDYAAYTKAVYKQPDGKEKDGTKILAGDPKNERSGTEARIYFPHLGSVQEYFLKGLQCALRPQGMCGSADLAVAQTTQTSSYVSDGTCVAPQPDSKELEAMIDAAVARGEAASKVPRALLRAIYKIESQPYYTSGQYDCTENNANAHALGLMQIVTGGSFYNAAVSQSQRPGLENEEKNCKPIEGKLNRCYPPDEIEIAARILLEKADYLPDNSFNKFWDSINFKPLASLVNKSDIFLAAWGYYGSNCADTHTVNFAIDEKNNLDQTQCRPGGSSTCGTMGYGDLVCLIMGKCPTYPSNNGSYCSGNFKI